LKPSGKHSLYRRFSHIYLENRAAEYPLTRRVLAHFNEATVVRIDNYKRVFNRPRQDFQLQKRAPKLIIAVKNSPYLYRGSDQCQSYGLKNFYYTTPMLNCPFNCDYCYLQGMYPSSYLVFFANHDDFLRSARKHLRKQASEAEPLFASISYDTDILPFESTTHYARDWIELAKQQTDLRIEIRTKSAAYRCLDEMDPVERVVLSWSLSPPALAKRYEHGAPTLARRLSSINQAIAGGWRVRLCLDPVLPTEDPVATYGRAIEQIAREIDLAKVVDVSVGPFRMGKTHFRRIKKLRPDSALFHRNGGEDLEQITDYVASKLAKYLPKEKVIRWKSQL